MPGAHQLRLPLLRPPEAPTCGFIGSNNLTGTNSLQIFVCGSGEQVAPQLPLPLLRLIDGDHLLSPAGVAGQGVAHQGENPDTRIIDASTAHRTAPGWVYGFPELGPEQRAAVASAKRVANPGCYATGFIALIAPLVRRGLLGPDTPLVCHALSGYTGGEYKSSVCS